MNVINMFCHSFSMFSDLCTRHVDYQGKQNRILMGESKSNHIHSQTLVHAMGTIPRQTKSEEVQRKSPRGGTSKPSPEDGLV